MNTPRFGASMVESKSRRSCLYSVPSAVSLLCLLLFIASAFVRTDFPEKFPKSGMSAILMHNSQSDDYKNLKTSLTHGDTKNDSKTDNGKEPTKLKMSDATKSDTQTDNCKKQCRPSGAESLPVGIVSATSNLDTRPLWGFPKKKSPGNLLAMAVGIRQKDLVNKMVEKFLGSGFVVMLFHYDGIVDQWKVFSWNDHVIHVSAANQTKWWFSKRFLHPDVVAEYDYVFLWDEDIGVEYFNPERYMSIVKSEGLEISQPALDLKSEIHHQITARGRRSIVHRRTFKPGGPAKGCDENSKGPPCTGWIEVMAPVFSKAAWRCVWHMIQNDLIHAWGLDMQLGYCAQGDRTKNIGIVDSEYIVHHGLPTLGDVERNKENSQALDKSSEVKNQSMEAARKAQLQNYRVEVRRQSFTEFKIFKNRWKTAATEDRCWVDPYPGLKPSMWW